MKKLLLMLAMTAMLTACDSTSGTKDDKQAAGGDSIAAVEAQQSGQPAAAPTGQSKFVPTGDLEADAEAVVVNSLAVTKALLTGSATQEQQNEASQALLDAIKYYNSLDEAKGKEFQNLVNKKLKEHAAEFKVSK